MTRRGLSEDPRAVRTHHALVDATVRMLHEMPADTISVTALVQEAEVSRQVFYEHYEDRDAVIHAAGKAVFKEPYETFAAAVAEGGGIIADEQFGEHVAALFVDLNKDRDTVLNLMTSPVRGALNRFAIRIMEEPVVADLYHRFEARDTESSEVHERKARNTARFLAAGMQGVFSMGFKAGLPPEEVGRQLEEVRDTILAGLSD